VHLTSLLPELSQKIKFDTKSKGEICLTRQACSHNLTLWLVRLMYLPPRLSQKPHTVSFEKGDCITILFRQEKKNVLTSSFEMPDIFALL
jgi:hypothetical protein